MNPRGLACQLLATCNDGDQLAGICTPGALALRDNCMRTLIVSVAISE